MARSRLESILGAAIQSLRRDSRSDAELLARFLDQRDETAFETLVVRHTPAVRAACRGWLRAAMDIDDAAQAAFLVLVQRGRSIREPAALGRWLYRVAENVARRLRRQQRRSCPLPEDLPGRQPAAYDDLRDLLAEEVARLPEKYRLPVQLCYMAGLTTAEAAQRLGWPKGTVLTRLAWARERLQKRLTERGVAPAILAGLLMGTAVPAVNGAWVRVTARAAMAMLAGESPVGMGVSGGTVSLTEGVVRAMFYDRLKYFALAALLAIAGVGFGIGHWASASNGNKDERKSLSDKVDPRAAREKDAEEPSAAPGGKDAAKVKEIRPGVPNRRREAVIRLPVGTFTKEVEAAPYGSGRLTWTYEEDRVLGLIEVSAMGGEIELATEAEYSLSSNGTIYGLITSVRLNHLRLPDNKEFEELKPFVGLWSAVEPLVNETLMDLPFSYQFRVQGDRLVISNFRILLAGPNPLGKLGGLAAGGNNGEFAVLSYFQAVGIALEGTYTAGDAKEKAPLKKRPLRPKSGSRVSAKTIQMAPWVWGSGRGRNVGAPVLPPAAATLSANVTGGVVPSLPPGMVAVPANLTGGATSPLSPGVTTVPAGTMSH
jgi:RNA polymerase sigma factor (sigma-70 family)